jgi:glucose/arabinose dehydrogenase
LNPATGRLWTSEHGAQGGDEINTPAAGRNYGWPLITHGVDYSGASIGRRQRKSRSGTAGAPLDAVDRSSGLAFYDADRFSGWRGNLFSGSLKNRMLVRLELQGDRVVHQEELLTSLRQRIRDVRQGPDGNIYVLTDERSGRLIRIEPAAA